MNMADNMQRWWQNIIEQEFRDNNRRTYGIVNTVLNQLGNFTKS